MQFLVLKKTGVSGERYVVPLTWQDMRTKTKGKKSKINKHYSGTGGGEQTKEILTPAEIIILDLISPVEVDGHPVLESSTDFQYEFDNVEVIYEDTHVELNNTSNCENTIVTQISMPVACASTPSNVINNPHTEVSDKNNSRNDATPNKAKSKTNVSSHRLQQSAEASNRLAAACEKKISLKANYYEQKLKLLQDKNIIMGQLVKTLQSISEKM
ncbi:hypothetical protein FQR65_LT17615 [Abscondita terminalis]|nr:hypothetical protein FQR65_LT17615 [Abscondita terminalis]